MFPPGVMDRAAWMAQRAAFQARRAAQRAERHRRFGFFGHLLGFFWGGFWILFALSLAFGGDSYRREVFDFVQGVGRWAADFFRSLMGTGIQ
jgi:hypothetical protein